MEMTVDIRSDMDTEGKREEEIVLMVTIGN